MQREPAWDDWRYFLAVADAGTLSGGARTLRVNQSTVFRRIGQLEEALGARLFDRLPRGVALTPAGEAVLPAARRLGDDASALARAVAGADSTVRGVIRLTTVLELFERIAGPLAAFRERHPGVQLEVSTDARVMRLGRFEADVALRPGRAPTEPDVVGRRLAPSGIGLYASRAYLDQRGRPETLAQLAAHTAVGYRGPAGHGATVMVVDSKLAQARACRAGLGIAELPSFLGDPDPELERLFLLPVEDVHLWLLIHTELRRVARIRALVNFLTEALR